MHIFPYGDVIAKSGSIRINKIDYVSLEHISERLGMEYMSLEEGEHAKLSSMSSSSGHALSDGDMEFHNANDFDATSALFACFVQSRMVKELKAVDRGLKRARFAVLRPLKCPGVLVECGFISNPA